MSPKRGTRTRTAPATATATTPMTDVAIRALIAQGVDDALAGQEIQRNTNLNGDGSQGSGSGITRLVRPTRECTYSDFLKYQSLNFKGTEGVVGLTQWFERMETVFYIDNCGVENQVKFATCTLLGSVFDMVELLCQDSYTQRFQELAWMCGRMYLEESDEVETYIGGLPDIIQGNVMSARQAENKRKFDNNNQAQQQLPKRQNVAQAYNVRTGKRKEYAGTLPLCNKCKFHHNGPYITKCTNCKKVGYLTRDCWNPTTISNQRTITCYECGNQGHYKSDCPKLETRNHRNQAEGTEVHGMVYALGGGETNQDLYDMEDDINA
ncbi:putative reverse transcriptase domain-containing protein [Tanacetum coccineum]